MILIQVAGGLGNQMQEYSMYRKLKALGKEVKLDLSWFTPERQKNLLAPRKLELSYFPGLPMEVCSDAERAHFLGGSRVVRKLREFISGSSLIFQEKEMYHPEIFRFTDKYLMGFFLCQKYYNDIMPELRDAFQFPIHHEGRWHLRNMDLMNEMEQVPSVSVHIRRGDYLTPENVALFGGITTDAYYESAIDYFRAKNPNTHFYIFTNDTAYALNRYADTKSFTIIDWNTGKDSLLDIQLMSHCQGNICANSTFSFWGARLNRRQDHEVIRPFVMRNNQVPDRNQMHDYWKGWILMDHTGKIV